MGEVRASLFGALAVKAGLASKAQVDECVAEQQAARERSEPIPKLGELMAQKGYLSLDQVAAILRGDFAVPGRRFGELCLQMQFCSMKHVQEALDEQERLRKDGFSQRIGNILAKHGHIRSQQIPVVLQAQGFEIGECSKCRLTYNVDMNSPTSALTCARCGRELIMVTGYDEVDLSDVIHDIKPAAAHRTFPALGPDLVPVADSLGEITEEEVSLAEEIPDEGVEEVSPEQALAELKAMAPAAMRTPAPVAADAAEEPRDFGEFRTVQKIGHDALGILYRAKNTLTGEDVALKVIDLDRTRDHEFAERFIRESRLAASLEHPALKRVSSAGRAHGHLYYASEFIMGKSVRQLIESEGRVSIKAAHRILRTVAEGLRYAHSREIFHGDIRPSHILVTPEGSIKLAETGVAKNICQNMERLVRVSGLTPFYTAPELATPQGKVNARSDMFELGATYYHMIAGKAAFEGTSPLQVFMLMAEREAPRVHLVNASVPIQVSDVIRTMMAPEPDDRYQTMEQLMQALDQTEGAQSISELPAELGFQPAEAAPEGLKVRRSPMRRAKRRVVSDAQRGTARRARGKPDRTAMARGRGASAKQGGQSQLALAIVLLLVFIGAAALIVVLVMSRQNRTETPDAAGAMPPITAPTVGPVLAPARAPAAVQPAQPPPQAQPAAPREAAPAHGSSLFGPGGSLNRGD